MNDLQRAAERDRIANETPAGKTAHNRAHRYRQNKNVQKRKQDDSQTNQQEMGNRRIVEQAISELPCVTGKHLVQTADVQATQAHIGLESDKLDAWIQTAKQTDRKHRAWIWALVEG